MLVEVLKPFPFSRDGVTAEQAVVGVPADVPDHLVRGLERAKYIRQTKAMAGAPENKVEPAVENKADAVITETADAATEDATDGAEAAESDAKSKKGGKA